MKPEDFQKKVPNLMIQGTASNSGKSLLTAALGRIMKQDGYAPLPFKSQNMALNSFITSEGLEMGRAQVVQAEACGAEPLVCMNPILLKPTTDSAAQVIVNGKVDQNYSAREYWKHKSALKEIILDQYEKLQGMGNPILIEGAGSPAEINLNRDDFVNMGMAAMVDAPVILVGDIDRGGVFASLYGTIRLLAPEEQARIRGVIINKFRGDIKLLESGLKQLEDLIEKPVLGVVPWLVHNVEEEDSLAQKLTTPGDFTKEIRIAVIRLPHMSNFTDFDPFSLYKEVCCHYTLNPGEILTADMIILPGSKNSISDLQRLREWGLDEVIREGARKGIPLWGICGGLQILGQEIIDPFGVEGKPRREKGIGLLELSTTLGKGKTTTQGEAVLSFPRGFYSPLDGETVRGYEIHMGRTRGEEEPIMPPGEGSLRGVVKDKIGATYFHGLFDNHSFTRKLINILLKKRGLPGVTHTPGEYQSYKEKEYDRLADHFRDSLDMERIYAVMDGTL